MERIWSCQHLWSDLATLPEGDKTFLRRFDSLASIELGGVFNLQGFFGTEIAVLWNWFGRFGHVDGFFGGLWQSIGNMALALPIHVVYSAKTSGLGYMTCR